MTEPTSAAANDNIRARMAATLPVTNAGDLAGVDRGFASEQRSVNPGRRIRRSAIPARSRSALRIGAVWVWILPTALQAQVKLDGSLGAKGPVLPNAANQFRITPDLGHQAGANLFHSFEQFNLTKGQAAVFSGPSSVHNVLARVTGGASSIDGTLTSEIPGANLFLLNPKGILFGANAMLNIDGAFHASTADYIALEDGKRFEVGLGDNTKLSAAPPAAFGFLGPGSGSISVSKAQLINPKGNLSLVGGDLEIAGDGKSGVARVVAPGYTVLLASMKSAGELVIAPSQVAKSAAGFRGQGDISIQAAAVVSATPASGTAGGQVMIRGGKLTVKNATIEKNSHHAGTGLGVDIETTGDLTLGRGAIVSAEGHHPDGKADGLRVAADNMSLEAGSHVLAGTHGAGDGPDLEISARTSLRADGEIQVSNAEKSSGNGGRMSITATTTELRSGDIFLENRGDGEPPALLLKSDTLTMLPFAAIRAGTYGSRPGASLTLEVGDLSMLNGSQLVANTVWAGPAGTITINARRSVNLLGADPRSDAVAPTLISAASNRGSISEPHLPGNSGAAGEISVTAERLRVEGPGATISSLTEGAGHGGSIQLHVDHMELIDGGSVVAESSGSGSAGRILVDGARLGLPAESLVIRGAHPGGSGYLTGLSVDGGMAPDDEGDGGAIQVTARSIVVSGAGAEVSSFAHGTRKAGEVRLASQGDMVIGDGAKVVVNSESSEAGDIELTAGGSLLLVNGRISAEGAEGGQISLSAVDRVYLLNSTVSAYSTSGNGGNIAIPRLQPQQGGLDAMPGVTPRFVILNHSRLEAYAEGSGKGGNVGIVAGAFVRSPDSTINVSSSSGIDGEQSLPSGPFELPSILAELRPVFVDQAAQWQTAARPEQIDPGGYTLVGRRRFGNTSMDDQRRIILHR